jgi:hypothetical protein
MSKIAIETMKLYNGEGSNNIYNVSFNDSDINADRQ